MISPLSGDMDSAMTLFIHIIHLSSILISMLLLNYVGYLILVQTFPEETSESFIPIWFLDNETFRVSTHSTWYIWSNWSTIFCHVNHLLITEVPSLFMLLILFEQLIQVAYRFLLLLCLNLIISSWSLRTWKSRI